MNTFHRTKFWNLLSGRLYPVDHNSHFVFHIIFSNWIRLFVDTRIKPFNANTMLKISYDWLVVQRNRSRLISRFVLSHQQQSIYVAIYNTNRWVVLYHNFLIWNIFSVKTCSTPKSTDLVILLDSRITYNCGDKVNKTNVSCDSIIDGNLIYNNICWRKGVSGSYIFRPRRTLVARNIVYRTIRYNYIVVQFSISRTLELWLEWMQSQARYGRCCTPTKGITPRNFMQQAVA